MELKTFQDAFKDAASAWWENMQYDADLLLC